MRRRQKINEAVALAEKRHETEKREEAKRRLREKLEFENDIIQEVSTGQEEEARQEA